MADAWAWMVGAVCWYYACGLIHRSVDQPVTSLRLTCTRSFQERRRGRALPYGACGASVVRPLVLALFLWTAMGGREGERTEQKERCTGGGSLTGGGAWLQRLVAPAAASAEAEQRAWRRRERKKDGVEQARGERYG